MADLAADYPLWHLKRFYRPRAATPGAALRLSTSRGSLSFRNSPQFDDVALSKSANY